MTIQVLVTLFGALKSPGEASTFTLELPKRAKVSDVMSFCGLPDRVDIWALVDGQKASRGHELHDGSTVQFFQPVGGG